MITMSLIRPWWAFWRRRERTARDVVESLLEGMVNDVRKIGAQQEQARAQLRETIDRVQ